MTNVAIIPARGGSKRIPRKNIRAFLGKPIIAYVIDEARESGLFDRILVSTDDSEIAAVAESHGAEAPFVRPPELSDDHAGTTPVIQHAIEWLQQCGTPVDYACCIYPTAPFLTASILTEAFDTLRESGKDYAFSVARFRYPIQRALKRTPTGGVTPFQPEFIPCRSQDLEPAFHDAGQFYWGKVEAFLKGLPMFSDAAAPIMLPDHRVMDIDDELDWQQAEWMYRALQLMEGNEA